MSLISLSSLQPSPQYGIVLDAGSSHTAMYIYKWPADKQNGTGVVTQHSECHPKGKSVPIEGFFQVFVCYLPSVYI